METTTTNRRRYVELILQIPSEAFEGFDVGCKIASGGNLDAADVIAEVVSAKIGNVPISCSVADH